MSEHNAQFERLSQIDREKPIKKLSVANIEDFQSGVSNSYRCTSAWVNQTPATQMSDRLDTKSLPDQGSMRNRQQELKDMQQHARAVWKAHKSANRR